MAGPGRFEVQLNGRLPQFKWVLDLDNIAVSVEPLVAFFAPVSLEIQNRLLEVWHLGPESFSEPNRADAMRILENSDRFAALRPPFSALMPCFPEFSAEGRLANVKAVFHTAARLDLVPVFL